MNAQIKNTWIASMFILGAIFYSCGGRETESHSTNSVTKDEAENHNDAKFDQAAEADAQFLVDAASINFEEIQLGNLAVTKGSSNEVKDLGKVMNNSHAKAQSDLANLASKKGITVPVSPPDESMRSYEILKTEANKNFDKKFADMVVDAHKDAIKVFMKASTESQDTEIRNWAASMLPELRAHLDQAMNCKDNLRAEK